MTKSSEAGWFVVLGGGSPPEKTTCKKHDKEMSDAYPFWQWIPVFINVDIWSPLTTKEREPSGRRQGTGTGLEIT